MRDRWICHVCRRPVVFHLALKYLELEVKRAMPGWRGGYWNRNWRRDKAPLIDELGASVDHVEAFAKGGAHDISNFKTICSRCNARKSDKDSGAFLQELKPWKVRGKHGEPADWDGMASAFVVLARRHESVLTPTERKWLAALEKVLG